MAEGPRNRIRELRVARNLRERQAAAAAGMDLTSYHRRESGETDDLAKLRPIAKAFGVKLSELLLDEDVDFRVDDTARALVEALNTVPAEDRLGVVRMAIALVAMLRKASLAQHAIGIDGDPATVDALIQTVAAMDAPGRARALELLRVAG